MRSMFGAAPGETPPAPKADSSVAELQRTLTAYAQITGYAPANPGPVDGIVGTKTALAVLLTVPRIPKVPDEIAALARLGPLALSNDDMRTSIFRTITNYAGYISAAIIAAQAYQAVAGNGPGYTPPSGTVRAGTLVAPGITATAGTTWQLTPGAGGAVPANPAMAIWHRDWWTGMYRVAVPRGAGLGGYTNYVEVSPAASKPASGTEVNRSTFMSAVGKWWGTTAGIIGITVAAVGGGVGVYYGAQVLRR